MAAITVRHEGGDRFEIEVRGHRLVVDQPVDAGGDDGGPTPTELFAASLASCVGFYAERFLRRHALPVDGLEVACDFEMSRDRPARVAAIRLEVLLPVWLKETHHRALLAVIDKCTVHNSLRQEPHVATRVLVGVAARPG
jgi:putative redox protein